MQRFLYGNLLATVIFGLVTCSKGRAPAPQDTTELAQGTSSPSGLGLPPTPPSPPPQPWVPKPVTPPPPNSSISSPPALPGQELRSPPPAVPHANPPARQGPPLPLITPWNMTRWGEPSPPPGTPPEYATPIDPRAAASNYG